MISVQDGTPVGTLGDLSAFRRELYRSLTRRADALFELCDAVLCADGPVTSLVGLSLAAEHRRGHGALYDALACGTIVVDRLRTAVDQVPLPRHAGGRIVLAVDVSPWLRPQATTSPERSFCHTYGRGKGRTQMIPGWPYSFVAALEPGRTSWTAVLDAVRLRPSDDATEITAGQIRAVLQRLAQAGQWRDGDPPILVVLDAGYDVIRLAWLLRDQPVHLLGRMRSDRVFYQPPPPRVPGRNGRPPRHGRQVILAEPATHPDPDVATRCDTDRYGTARAAAWDRLHPLLTRRSAWAGHPGQLPILEGTLIRLTVDRLPGERHPKPVWLWHSVTGLTPTEVDRLWQAFLRRFDLEHTFRLLKQTLGWTRPKLRSGAQADLWTWLIIAAYTQLRLARHLTDDLRRPWERPPTKPGRLTPARVRRGFRHLRPKTAQPASAPKPSRPGPGRPPGSKNKQPTPRPDVGKHTTAKPTNKQQTG